MRETSTAGALHALVFALLLSLLAGLADPVGAAAAGGSPASPAPTPLDVADHDSPGDLIGTRARLAALLGKAAETYLLPWQAGQGWENYYGWHCSGFSGGVQCLALDFVPGPDVPQDGYLVLAAHSGWLTEICGAAEGDSQQSTLRIESADGAVIYAHLDAASIPRQLLGQHVSQGQYIGKLYYVGNPADCVSGGCWFSSPCGYGSTTHLHLELPARSTVIGGYSADEIAASGGAVAFVSTNQAVGLPPRPAALAGRLVTLSLPSLPPPGQAYWRAPASR